MRKCIFRPFLISLLTSKLISLIPGTEKKNVSAATHVNILIKFLLQRSFYLLWVFIVEELKLSTDNVVEKWEADFYLKHIVRGKLFFSIIYRLYFYVKYI